MSINLVKPESVGRFVAVVGGASDPYAAYRAYDSFTDANGTAIASHAPEKGGPWASFGGAFTRTIESNRLSVAANGGAEGGIQIDAGAADVTITVDLASVQDSYMGIVFNWQDASNFWWFGPSPTNGQWFIFLVTGGTPAIFNADSAAVPAPGDFGTIQVITAGDLLTCKKFSGATSYSGTIGGRSFKTATRHGLYSGYSVVAQLFDTFTIQ